MPDAAPILAVVIATYNEAANAPRMVREIKRVVPSARVIVVDDDSPDGTTEIVRGLGIDGVEVLCRTRSRGYGTAVRDGLLLAARGGATRIVTMDCDFSHDPSVLPEMFATLDGADVAVGSRYVGGVRVLNWDVRRLMLSLFANFYVRTILRLPASDCTSGYRAYRVELLRRLRLRSVRSNGYAFLVEMLFRARLAGARISEVPIIFTERAEGESKMSGGVILESVFMPWRLLLGRY